MAFSFLAPRRDAHSTWFCTTYAALECFSNGRMSEHAPLRHHYERKREL